MKQQLCDYVTYWTIPGKLFTDSQTKNVMKNYTPKCVMFTLKYIKQQPGSADHLAGCKGEKKRQRKNKRRVEDLEICTAFLDEQFNHCTSENLTVSLS